MAYPIGLSEDDISVKFITPALHRAGWAEDTQIRRQVSFTRGRIIVRGRMVARGKPKRADFVLYHQHIALALIEAKRMHVDAGHGMQQALDYASALDVPFVFSSNGKGFVLHDRSGLSAQLETELSLDEFPSPQELWTRYRQWKGYTPEQEQIVLQPYHDDGSSMEPRVRPLRAVRRSAQGPAAAAAGLRA